MAGEYTLNHAVASLLKRAAELSDYTENDEAELGYLATELNEIGARAAQLSNIAAEVNKTFDGV